MYRDRIIIMKEFLKVIYKKNLLTDFLNDVFEYKDFGDYNYIYRLGNDDTSVIIDVYDNVSINRFNIYIYCFFNNSKDKYIVREIDNVYVHYYDVFKIGKIGDKKKMFGHLFTISYNDMLEYARRFMDNKYVECLNIVLKNKSNL